MSSSRAPLGPRPHDGRWRSFAAVAVLAVASVVAVQWGSNALIDAVAKRAAAWLTLALRSQALPQAQPALSRYPEAAAAEPDSLRRTSEGEVDALHGFAVERRTNRAARERGSAAKPRARVIYVGPDAVKNALPPAARPVASWTEALATSPAGVRLTSAGGLASFMRVGDILVEAEGQRLHDFSELIAVVARAYERRSKTLVGQIWRAGELWSVVVEPGW